MLSCIVNSRAWSYISLLLFHHDIIFSYLFFILIIILQFPSMCERIKMQMFDWSVADMIRFLFLILLFNRSNKSPLYQ